MRRQSVKLFVQIFLILCLIISVDASSDLIIQIHNIKSARYVSYYDLIKDLGLSGSYDFYARRGKLYYRSHMAVFTEGYSVALVDGRLAMAEYPVIRHKGDIMIPVGIALSFFESFYGEAYEQQGKILVKMVAPSPKIPELPAESRYVPEKSYPITFIVIDPGHGGKDPGAIGVGGIKEKQIVLQVSRYLKNYLRQKHKTIKIYMTRSSDRFIELSKRTEYANRYLRKGENGIFISIHANASISRKISGFETYFLSQNPSNEEARNTATLENNVIILEANSGKSYSDVDYIEAAMMTAQIQRESSLLSSLVQDKMDSRISQFKSRGVKKADFFVLRGALMPAVLVEIGYLTNNKECVYLKRRSYQRSIARGIADGIDHFLIRYGKLYKSR